MPDTTPLPPPECPVEGCTWTVRHCHLDGAAYSRRYDAPRTQPTPLDALLAAADDAKRAHDRLCDLAETLLPESSPVKTADNPALRESFEAAKVMWRQRVADNQPCPTCGGDRLRTDLTGSGRCHDARADQ